MNFRRFVFFFYLLLFPLLAQAESQSITKQKMLNDLQVIRSAFEVRYAPVKWKKEFAGWDLDEQTAIAQQKILNTPDVNIKDYQKILHQFFNSTQDYHVKIVFYSTEFSMLPFRVQGAQGRYFVVWKADLSGINDSDIKNTFGDLSFSVGDEVLAINGKNPQIYLEELTEKDYGPIDTETNRLLAEKDLTFRKGSLGQEIPQGKISFTIKSCQTGKVTKHKLKWLYVEERIQDNLAVQKPQHRNAFPLKKKVQEKVADPKTLFNKNMTAPYYRASKNVAKKALAELRKKGMLMDSEGEDGFEVIGSKNSLLPPLGSVIWEAPSRFAFQAYTFITPSGKKVGFVRIPSFKGGAQEARQFANIIQEFEKSTDGLVIDQMNNPGGYAFYLYALASTLTDKPLETLKEKVTITQEDIAEAIEFLDEATEDREKGIKPWEGQNINGFNLDRQIYEGMLDYFQFVVDEWKEGRVFTNCNYTYGIKSITPHPAVKYTKPIVLLVNGLDFSAGDFFPALMQDNNRAIIFGTKTAGAGGYVLENKHHNMFGVALFTLTGSIAERPDGKPLENLGVIPDIEYRITEKDLCENYTDYVKALLEVIEQKF